MNLLRKIALLAVLLIALFHAKQEEQSPICLPQAQLTAEHTGREWALVRHHAQLVLPAAFEAPAPAVRLITRPQSKSGNSRHHTGSVAQSIAALRSLIHSFGGSACPMAVTSASPHEAFVRLCRWII